MPASDLIDMPKAAHTDIVHVQCTEPDTGGFNLNVFWLLSHIYYLAALVSGLDTTKILNWFKLVLMTGNHHRKLRELFYLGHPDKAFHQDPGTATHHNLGCLPLTIYYPCFSTDC